MCYTTPADWYTPSLPYERIAWMSIGCTIEIKVIYRIQIQLVDCQAVIADYLLSQLDWNLLNCWVAEDHFSSYSATGLIVIKVHRNQVIIPYLFMNYVILKINNAHWLHFVAIRHSFIYNTCTTSNTVGWPIVNTLYYHRLTQILDIVSLSRDLQLWLFSHFRIYKLLRHFLNKILIFSNCNSLSLLSYSFSYISYLLINLDNKEFDAYAHFEAQYKAKQAHITSAFWGKF